MKKSVENKENNSKKIFDQKGYIAEYKRKNIKRIPLDIQLESYEIWKKAADSAGLPLNTFIKQAVQDKIDGMESAEKHDDTLL